jgi:hypothetical protein
LNEIAIRSFLFPLRVVDQGLTPHPRPQHIHIALRAAGKNPDTEKPDFKPATTRYNESGLTALRAHILRNVVNNPLTKVTFLLAGCVKPQRLDVT